jgi:GNAT superfamily N-acetyltransferase
MLKVTSMTLNDIDRLNLSEQWLIDKYKQYLTGNVGPAYFVEDEHGLLCAFGAAFLWPGVCEVWFKLIAVRKGFQQLRIAKRYLDEHIQVMKIRRCEANVKCNFAAGIRFIEYLGFHSETPFGRKCFNPDGSDSFLYARIM